MSESNGKLATPRPPAIYWIASLALAGGLLYYSLRGIEWARVWTTVRRAQPQEVALALVTLSLALFLRSVRWRVLLTAEGRVTIPLAFWATSAGYLGNNVLPARAGEVVRTMMISSRSGMTTVLSAHAIGLSIGLPLAFLLIAGLGLGSALPSTPGYVGIYQFVAVSVLTPFGLSRTDAIAYILFYQAVSYVVVLSWGLIALGQQRGAIFAKSAAIAPPK